MSKRALLIAGIALGVFAIGNILILIIYLPKLSRSTGSKSAATPGQQSASAVQRKPVAPVPLADGAIVQREELSPSGNIRLKYVRKKGDPVRQIILESVSHPGESKVLFQYERNAWILISPNDEWVALNNRPSAGHSEVHLYHHDGPGTLDYTISEDTGGSNTPLDGLIWNYYTQELGLSPETPRDGVAIDAVGWDADSKKLAVTVTVTQADPEDTVPPPWRCIVDLASKEIDVNPEAIEAFNARQVPGSVPAQQAGSVTAPQIPAATGASATPLQGDFAGERYQETRTRPLTPDEISHWSLTNTRYAIEEIYARRGAEFNDQPSVRKQFSKFAWYHPRSGITTDQIKTELSDVERQNLDALEKSRDAKRAAASKSRAPRNRDDKITRFFKKIFSK